MEVLFQCRHNPFFSHAIHKTKSICTNSADQAEQMFSMYSVDEICPFKQGQFTFASPKKIRLITDSIDVLLKLIVI